jgi:23S rRNA-/tRNA-specific pseudouridylate synthase
MNIDASPSKPAVLPQIIFEDAEIVVLNKPAGLLVLPDRFDPSIPNLYGLLKNKYGQIYVVHRIDKETSGLIIFAKNETSHRALTSSLKIVQRKNHIVQFALENRSTPMEKWIWLWQKTEGRREE